MVIERVENVFFRFFFFFFFFRGVTWAFYSSAELADRYVIGGFVLLALSVH